MPPILHACWGAFSGSLRSVSLDIPIELLNPCRCHFMPFRAFLNNYTRSLQTTELSLRTAGSWMHPSIFRGGQFNFGPLFRGLYYVPHLNSLAP
jgi:hypothetical protein